MATQHAETEDASRIESTRAVEKLPTTAHRLVLLALAAPLIGLGVALWLLLPGGVAGASYPPSDFSQAVQVQTQDWKSRDAEIRGYAERVCTGSDQASCQSWVLVDAPTHHALTLREALQLGALRIAPQQESAIYAFMRHFVPGLSRPFPQGIAPDQLITIAGRLAAVPPVGGIPTLAPHGL